jgi:carbamoyltransferase
MQYSIKCLKPKIVPSIVHQDGTSRVQTVSKKDNPNLYKLLKKWDEFSGVPILLNTSLNIKNQPLLNDKNDLVEWEKYYGKKVY